MSLLFLAIALGAALDYGLRHSWRLPNFDRSMTKTCATLSLIIFASLANAPGLLIVGLGFAAIGDYSGSRGPLRWMLLSATAFLACHTMYVLLYLERSYAFAPHSGPGILLGFTGVSVMVATCWRTLAALRLAVVMYTPVILVQFVIGQTVPPEFMTIAYATTLFLISGCLLGLELFAIPLDSGVRRWSSPVVWLTYFAAQVLVIFSFVEIEI